MKILIDECVPVGIKKHLGSHEVFTVRDMDWLEILNGKLLTLAENEGFNLIITADGHMYGQQHLKGRDLALLAIPTNNIKIMRSIIPQIVESIEHVESGIFYVIKIEGLYKNWHETRLHEIEEFENRHVRHYKQPKEISDPEKGGGKDRSGGGLSI